MINRIYEHLITKRKYKKLEVKLDVLREELERKITELNVERQVWKKKQNVWEDTLLKQEQEIIELKRRKKRKQNEKEN